MIVLDTNVVSELMRGEPAGAVVEWVDAQPGDEVFLTAVTLAELLYGIARLPDGRRKTTLAGLLEAMVVEDFEHHRLVRRDGRWALCGHRRSPRTRWSSDRHR